MPPVLLGQNAYRRDGGHMPPIRLKNRYFEADPTNAVDHVALMPRPAKPYRPSPSRPAKPCVYQFS